MNYLKGNAKVILEEVEKLWLNPPKDWEKYECKDERFIGQYIWFKYIGSHFPNCYIYIPNTVFLKDKVHFMILPESNDEKGTLLRCYDNIINSLFDTILSDEINLGGE